MHPSPRAKLVRRVLPAALLLSGLSGWLIAEMTLTEVRFTWVEASMLTLLTCGLLAGFVAWVAFVVERSNIDRSQFEKALHSVQRRFDLLLSHVGQPAAEARLRWLVKIGTTVAILLISLVGLLSWRMARLATADANWVAHTHEVLSALQVTLAHLDDIETGGRGFALSGSKDFLGPYESAKDEIGHDLDQLRLLVSDNPNQARQLGVFSLEVNARIEASRALVAARQAGVVPTPQQMENGKGIMNAARLSVKRMEAEEMRLLQQRSRRVRVARQFASSVIGLGSVLGVTFLSIAGFTVGREIDVNARAKARIKALNADLEARVAQRTAALQGQAEELLRSQQALENQTLMLQSVLNSMGEGLIAADEHGKFLLWNPAAEGIIGLGAINLPAGEWGAHYGVFLPDMITPVPAGETPLEQAIRGVACRTELFLRNPGLDRKVWIETNSSPLRDKDGKLRGGVIAFRDITQRKADELKIAKFNEDLEEKITKRTAQLEAANHELEAFSYSVSHDLRTPLRHIAGFSRILMNDFGPVLAVEARDHLQRIEDAVRRMGLLVDALLKMAVLRRQPLRLCHSELNPIVDEVVSILQSECEGRDVEWRIAQLPALDCDPVLMGQVFQNLLGNALKYSRGKTPAIIEVDSIQQPGEPVIIFVRDNGAGFNIKYAEKLFGVFQRLHTESEFEGTGVGLATVHRIIQKHGGVIWAEADVDHGATFYFALQMTEQIGTRTTAGISTHRR
jgi:signal transduction histidine kinase/CHASE3 domain sensor protein